MSQIRLYKMTHATGFAPNYYKGLLTLATCKGYIRRSAKVGEWIGGLTSQNSSAGGTRTGEEKLIYLMKVTKTLTFDEYWEQYPERRPDVIEMGDNIYFPNTQGGYSQAKNPNHPEWAMATDLKSNRVLLSEEFRYFGKDNGLDISAFKSWLNIPKGVAPYGYKTENEHVDDFLKYVMEQQNVFDIDYTHTSTTHSTCGSCRDTSQVVTSAKSGTCNSTCH